MDSSASISIVERFWWTFRRRIFVSRISSVISQCAIILSHVMFINSTFNKGYRHDLPGFIKRRWHSNDSSQGRWHAAYYMPIICPIICMTILQFISIFYTDWLSTLLVLKRDSKANIKIFYSTKSSRDLKERRWKCIRGIFQNQSDFDSILVTTCIVNFYFWAFLKLWAFKRGHILSYPLLDGFHVTKHDTWIHAS